MSIYYESETYNLEFITLHLGGVWRRGHLPGQPVSHGAIARKLLDLKP